MSFAEAFEKDIRDFHLVYDFDAINPNTHEPEKWRYEIWFFSEDRVVYKIHSGPMRGRSNFQTCKFQCIRPGELWQCNWLEETGTVVSVVYDFLNNTVTALLAFSKGHWENAKDAHGNKRNPEDFERWRKLARIGVQTDRQMVFKQGQIVQKFRGAGDLEPIDPAWPTI